jgi:hypothetical protein
MLEKNVEVSHSPRVMAFFFCFLSRRPSLVLMWVRILLKFFCLFYGLLWFCFVLFCFCFLFSL